MTETPDPEAPQRQRAESPERDRRSRPPRRRAGRQQLVLIIAVAGAVGVVTWLIVRGGGTSAPSVGSTTVTTIAAGSASSLGPVAASPSALAAFSAALHRPIYWMGPVEGDTYEFTEASSGDLYVRYLTEGVHVGDKRAIFPVIA